MLNKLNSKSYYLCPLEFGNKNNVLEIKEYKCSDPKKQFETPEPPAYIYSNSSLDGRFSLSFYIDEYIPYQGNPRYVIPLIRVMAYDEEYEQLVHCHYYKCKLVEDTFVSIFEDLQETFCDCLPKELYTSDRITYELSKEIYGKNLKGMNIIYSPKKKFGADEYVWKRKNDYRLG